MRSTIAALAIGIGLVAPAAAQDLPLWEAKVGGFGFYTPDYPASGNYRLKGLAYPTLVYRGDVVRIGGSSAAKLVPFSNPRWEVGISLDAAFAADSDGNPARQGMPDLGLIGEVGPELVFHAITLDPGTDHQGTVDLTLQTRAMLTYGSDEGLEYRGLVIEPAVRVRKNFANGIRLRASAGPIFATEGVHDYYYGVASAFAAPGRPAYDARGGYLGSEAGIGVTVPVTSRLNIWSGVGVGLYSGAANQSAALHEEDLTGYAYLGASFTMFKSRRRSVRDD